MQQWIKEVARGKRGAKDLSYEQAKLAAETLFSKEATDVQIAAFLIAERIKTETPDELLAITEAMRAGAAVLQLPSDVRNSVIDFAGPYTGRQSFLATIPVSILLAESGIPAFLHSSDTLPPKYAISIKAVLDKLGVKTDSSPEQTAKTVRELNIGFASAEIFWQPFSRFRTIRDDIGVRTVLNTAEKLLNYAGAANIMMGAFHRTAIQNIYPVFEKLRYEQAFIVQGAEGSEDVPVHRNSFVFTISGSDMSSFILKPEDYGLKADESAFDKTLTAESQAKKITALLSGNEDPSLDYERKQVLMNAALRYYLFGHTASIEEGAELAKSQLRQKRGLRTLERWISGSY
ncbi:anthranilate phosphoribosyltransferase [Bacillus atrophaeus]|uniref:anthranilate phosphoribosyltransferase n=1 Tax=Bacillus atrophaeus TaxID=1452 RepID=UPI002E251F22|nr:anthranilate phosphoribosyltransferase [Bacillus atrophaeus]MED4814686.1 anthranilate phosphoribosyltransferase [Bacillus atrophaeus]MED4824146.1 anthranilate phosphoribosyltransferase [Bacillus atrophaeus]MED4843694.1 anthranilate phosphoribosyltransferase [Bacillus atrophaeus]